MKFQVNLRGSWRDIAEFATADLATARFVAGMLASVATGGRFALVNERGRCGS